eukprot:scaffold574_cov78-Skeletonema_dohrnii-CCMP3373.AAC.1
MEVATVFRFFHVPYCNHFNVHCPQRFVRFCVRVDAAMQVYLVVMVNCFVRRGTGKWAPWAAPIIVFLSAPYTHKPISLTTHNMSAASRDRPRPTELARGSHQALLSLLVTSVSHVHTAFEVRQRTSDRAKVTSQQAMST